MGAALALLTDATPIALALPTTAAALLAALSGEARIAFFAVGIAITTGATLIHGVPLGIAVPLSMLLGSLIRSVATRQKVVGELWTLVTCLLISTYWYLAPPETNSGYVAAYSLTIVPIIILALRTATRLFPTSHRATSWFVAGSTISVGQGLYEAYGAIHNQYGQYERVRIFESSIGSSNLAAGLAAVVGVYLLATSVKDIHRFPVVSMAISVPFLAAPLVFASRGALLALLCGLLILAIAPAQPAPGIDGIGRSRITRTLTILSLIAGITLIAAKSEWFIWERLTSAPMGGGYSSGRKELWEATWGMIASHPFAGVGPGHVADLLLRSSGFAYSHNSYLEIVAQLGILGGAVYLMATWPRPLLSWSPAIPAIVVMLVDSSVEPNMSTPPGAALYAGLIACHFAHTRSMDRRGLTP